MTEYSALNKNPRSESIAATEFEKSSFSVVTVAAVLWVVLYRTTVQRVGKWAVVGRPLLSSGRVSQV